MRTYTAPGYVHRDADRHGRVGPAGIATLTVPIVEPAGNVAPVPGILTDCIALVCSESSSGTVDPNVG